MPANHSNTKSVITILFYSTKQHFEGFLVMLLHCVAKDMTSLLISMLISNVEMIWFLIPQILDILAN